MRSSLNGSCAGSATTASGRGSIRARSWSRRAWGETTWTRATWRGEGCGSCDDSGYRGRVGLYEVMPITSDQRRLITNHASNADIRDQAVADGMLTLRQDGLTKMRAGITTLDEVLRETSNM